jgi:hypothetical protein
MNREAPAAPRVELDRPALTASQTAFRNRIRPILYVLFRCWRRLDACGFDQKSAIYQAVGKAYSAMHELHISLHYHWCGRGFGDGPRSDEP